MPDDIQCQSILRGLVALQEVLEKPLANTALDLGENAKTSHHKEILTRLRNSLTQYLERTGDLVYVAFIGHFSSGKSSTINSLLSLDGETQRQVGLHPTDKVITLITHKKNANSLLGIVSQGSVPLRVQALENLFLADIVLADTPGTGDPHLIEEMARDFLPICDFVLFFFSAASPLDSTDLPLLRELNRRLPFIPTMFVVTRADELKRNPDRPLSTDNFDSSKASTFKAETISRISMVLRDNNYSERDFVLIDNKADFNIAELRAELLERVDPHNVSNRVTMHSHKVSFFLHTSASLREFFSAFLDAKLNELNRIVSGAEKNIVKYNQSVSIANNNLTKSWFDHHTSILDVKSKAAERIKAIPDLPQSLLRSGDVARAISSLNSDLSKRSANIAELVENFAFQTIFQQLRRQISIAQQSIASADLDLLKPEDHGLAPLHVGWTFGDIDIIPVDSLSRLAESLRADMRKYVESLVLNLKTSLEGLHKSIQQRFAISRCEEIVAIAQRSLATDLDSYFQNVQVYRAGVFAMTTKASIAKLGIGEQLDRLETEFTEEDRESIQIEVRQALFPDFESVLAAAATQLAGVVEKIKELSENVSQIKVDLAPPVGIAVQNEAAQQLPSLQEEVKTALQSEIDDFIGSLQTKLSGVIGIALNEYERDRSAAQAKRTRKYTIVITSVGLSFLLGYAVYRWVKDPVGQSLIEILGWGVLIEIIGNLIGLGYLHFRDNYSETKRTIKERHSAALAEKVRSTVDGHVKDHVFVSLQNTVLGRKLLKIYTTITTEKEDAWYEAVRRQYQNLQTSVARYQEIRSTYLSILEGVVRDSSRYFENAEKNLHTLKSVATQIKDQAITPSFNLLAETSQELEDLRNEISGIQFT